VTAPRPVTALEGAGEQYHLTLRLRAQTAGRTVCAAIRQWNPAGTALLGNASRCATMTTAWAQLAAVAYTTVPGGGMLDVFVWQSGGVAGDSFDADAVSLTGPAYHPALLNNGSFEGSTAGWNTVNSSFSLVPGMIGSQALRASRTGFTYGLVASPRPVSAIEAAGEQYTLTLRARSQTPGKGICGAIRQWNAAGTAIMNYSHGCITLTSLWQQLPLVTHTTTAGAGSLDVLVWQPGGSVAGDSFDVDAIRMNGPAYNPGLLTNGSFEGSSSGWNSLQSTLAFVPGFTGAEAVRATRTGSTYGLYTSPRPSTGPIAAGEVFTLTLRARSQTPGKGLCGAIRQWNAAGTSIVKTTQKCLTLSSLWQQLPLASHTALAGGSLDVIIWQAGGSVAGDSFDVDAVRLARGPTP
jgi:hypothetical protein